MYFTWAASAQTLALLEIRENPGQETQTPTSIAMHSPARDIGALSDAAWYEFRPLIQPCWNYLSAFSDWLHTTYSPETHPEVFEIVNDTIVFFSNRQPMSAIFSCLPAQIFENIRQHLSEELVQIFFEHML